MKIIFFCQALILQPLVSTNASWFGNADDDQAISVNNDFEKFWVDAIDIANNLDDYDKLWIHPHKCVWSECAVDDTDDGYMGDNRDGDEQWYQYRTQGFCANAAYSLYGRKKNEFSFRGCSRGHFLNSFFTYGGADTLLKSIDQTPVLYNHNNGEDDANDDYNGDDGNNDDDASTNAACVEIDYEESDGDGDGDGDDSNSGSNDNNQYSATLGCNSDGNYNIAAFKSSSCDGNYFTSIVDEFEEYNNQHNAIGCHKIYDSNLEVSVDNILTLLNNSWSCDLRLYPGGCPDPWGTKKNFDFALRTIAHGGNPNLAYKNMIWTTPLHIISTVLLLLTIMIFVLAYIVKNESRAIQSKGGKNFIGYARCVAEDIAIGARQLWTFARLKFAAFMVSLSKDQKKSPAKKGSFEKSDSNSDTSDDYVHIDEEVENESKTGNDGKAEVQESFSSPSISMTDTNEP